MVLKQECWILKYREKVVAGLQRRLPSPLLCFFHVKTLVVRALTIQSEPGFHCTSGYPHAIRQRLFPETIFRVVSLCTLY